LLSKRPSLFVKPVKFFCQENTGYTQYKSGYTLPNIIGSNGGEDGEEPPSGKVGKEISVQLHIGSMYFYLLLELDRNLTRYRAFQ
jgi:hypothetical protein